MFTISLIYSHSSIYDPHIKGLTAGGGPIFTVVHIYMYIYIDDISYVYVQLYWWYIMFIYMYNYIDNISYYLYVYW